MTIATKATPRRAGKTTKKAPAKKATPKKAPAKKTEAPRQQAADALPADGADTSPPPEAETRPIVFRGRTIRVKQPMPEQAAAWERIGAKFAGVNSETVSGADARQIFRRGQLVILGIIATEDDKEWLDDLFVEGSLTLTEAAEIVTLTVDAFTPGDAAPKHGPVARRRP